MSEIAEPLKYIWSILEEIKVDLRAVDAKWDRHITEDAVALASLDTKLHVLCAQVGTLNKLITEGNGQKSVLVQLEHLNTEVAELKDKNEVTNNDFISMSRDKWITVGKIVGAIALALPGIVALLNGL
jgi:hypothetical protein